MMFRPGAILCAATFALAFQMGCPGPGSNEKRPRSAGAEARTTTSRPAPPRERVRPRVVPRVTASSPWLAGAHILISYSGARRAHKGVTRTKAEALQLANQLMVMLRKDPKLFTALAKKHSDGPTGKRGGFLGAWKRGRMIPAFDQAISLLRIGQIAGPVETLFGYHVMKRMPLPPYYAARHILISYVGANRARPTVTRTKVQALAFATKLAKQLQAKPAQFVAMAMKHSNGPSAVRGGSLGTWRKGRMVPAFDKAVAKLKIGHVSGVVETQFGYHIIKREPLPTKPARRP